MPRTPRAENRKRLARVLATGGHVADIQHHKTTRDELEPEPDEEDDDPAEDEDA
jgi:hypothetical protein